MGEYIVKTSCGDVRGKERRSMIEFLGIPYAEAPTGPLRFKRAVQKNPWNGVFEATAYGHAPIQYNNGVIMGDEDCLTVNIQRPKEGDHLPVFVWIYGGGYNTGYSSDPMYRGEAFVRDGILFVSFNYRTNVLGFYDFTTYPGCEEFDSNCGLSDQILALNWIRSKGMLQPGNRGERAPQLHDDPPDSQREYRPLPGRHALDGKGSATSPERRSQNLSDWK